MFTDTHCHLTDLRYVDAESVAAQTLANGVDIAVCIGYDVLSSEQSYRLANKLKGIYFSAGVHPDSANNYDYGKDVAIRSLCSRNKCVAVGEIGLDYHYGGEDRNKQAECFVKQMQIANDFDLPISVHSRDAARDTFELVKANISLLTRGGVMHCFSYGKDIAKKYLDMGFYLAFGGTLTYNNSNNVKEVFRYAPMDRILTETDSPYLPPQPFRGQTNYPQYVKYVAEEMANLKGLSVEEIAKITRENALNLFYKIQLWH